MAAKKKESLKLDKLVDAAARFFDEYANLLQAQREAAQKREDWILSGAKQMFEKVSSKVETAEDITDLANEFNR